MHNSLCRFGFDRANCCICAHSRAAQHCGLAPKHVRSRFPMFRPTRTTWATPQSMQRRSCCSEPRPGRVNNIQRISGCQEPTMPVYGKIQNDVVFNIAINNTTWLLSYRTGVPLVSLFHSGLFRRCRDRRTSKTEWRSLGVTIINEGMRYTTRLLDTAWEMVRLLCRAPLILLDTNLELRIKARSLSSDHMASGRLLTSPMCRHAILS